MAYAPISHSIRFGTAYRPNLRSSLFNQFIMSPYLSDEYCFFQYIHTLFFCQSTRFFFTKSLYFSYVLHIVIWHILSYNVHCFRFYYYIMVLEAKRNFLTCLRRIAQIVFFLFRVPNPRVSKMFWFRYCLWTQPPATRHPWRGSGFRRHPCRRIAGNERNIKKL